MRIVFALLALLNFAFSLELLRLSEFKDQNVSGWLASEKLDGVRAYWDGENLLSRQDKKLNAPLSFTKNFPKFALDGELYAKELKFEEIQASVMDKLPDEKAWSRLKFHVFDVPEASGGLLTRLEILAKFLKNKPNQNLIIIKQIKVRDNAQFLKFAENIIAKGGEGAVVREPNAPYERKRSKNALKFKKFKDAECEVTAINKGSGKYANFAGSLTCKALGGKDDKERAGEPKEGTIFKIGSGLSDKNRQDPPKIGSIITYKFQNLTSNGKPRFPIFLRIRED
ncbi:DNA ligase [Campylobacter concisus]|uniref:DNA ligase n=1 Tax=Campylobacter concisus TaxID=199 RepID=A0A7S9WX71_9BACT|nr:DNA ligase [Campylobacter concisus]MBS5828636.1 DNA ligase [Campylobacter concisus]QPH96653.1 DNA ligase [Campylobacter concisus]